MLILNLKIIELFTDKILLSILRGVFLCLNMHNQQAEGIELLLFMTKQQE